jgi:hypothetical protein
MDVELFAVSLWIVIGAAGLGAGAVGLAMTRRRLDNLGAARRPVAPDARAAGSLDADYAQSDTGARHVQNVR